MFMKNKIVRAVLCAALGGIGLYTGISCVATGYKAATQPYLMAGTVRFDFMGYTIIAVLNGVICVVAVLALTLLLIKMKKSK